MLTDQIVRNDADLTGANGGSSSQGVTYSTELQAVITYWQSQGYTVPSSTVLSALDVMIVSMKDDGTWANLDVLRITAFNNSALQNTARVNFKNPGSNEMSLVNLPTYGVAGFRGDGVSSCLDNLYNPSTQGINYAQNSASRFIWVRTAPTTGNRLDGGNSGTMNTMAAIDTTAQRINQSTASLNVSVNMSGTGYRAMDRPDSANVNVFVAKVKSARTATSAAMTNANQRVLATAAAFCDAEFSIYGMSASLTDTQHNNNVDRITAYLTAIGL
jgi:hypothetical protein